MSGPESSGGPISIGPTRIKVTPDGPLDTAWSALGCVYDPELCLDVVSLGLIYGVHEEDGTVVVDMTLTTPGCPASESLPEMARTAIQEALGGAASVEVHVVWDPPWSPAMMHDDAAGALGFRLG
ncbi:MAG: metal-sulfur cluster assembly factor [Acidimicrobiales bacterium]